MNPGHPKTEPDSRSHSSTPFPVARVIAKCIHSNLIGLRFNSKKLGREISICAGLDTERATEEGGGEGGRKGGREGGGMEGGREGGRENEGGRGRGKERVRERGDGGGRERTVWGGKRGRKRMKMRI